jgi:hypothetical protein
MTGAVSQVIQTICMLHRVVAGGTRQPEEHKMPCNSRSDLPVKVVQQCNGPEEDERSTIRSTRSNRKRKIPAPHGI